MFRMYVLFEMKFAIDIKSHCVSIETVALKKTPAKSVLGQLCVQ